MVSERFTSNIYYKIFFKHISQIILIFNKHFIKLLEEFGCVYVDALCSFGATWLGELVRTGRTNWTMPVRLDCGLTDLCLFCHLCKYRSNISSQIGSIGAIVPLWGIGGVLRAKVQYEGTKLASLFVRRMSAELGMLVISSGY